MALLRNTYTFKGIVRESFLLLFGAWVSYVCLRLVLLNDPKAVIIYSTPGSGYLSCRLIWDYSSFTLSKGRMTNS